MKLITRDTDYGVRALCYIATHKGAIVTVPELVSSLKIPKPFLRKLLQILTKRGILKSYKGKGGGFLLAKEARHIYLTDLMRIFQGGFELNECLLKKKLCPNRGSCCVRKKIQGIEKMVVKELKNITIQSIL